MLTGVDVSNWQGVIDWSLVAQSGCAFAFAKATEGATYTDPMFARNREEALKHGIAFGAYHYFRASSTVTDQVANFVKSVETLHKSDLPPVLDIEDPKQWTKHGKTELTAMALEWLELTEQALQTKPIIYTSPSFVDSMLDQSESLLAKQLAGYPLWLAHWTEKEPRVPKPWNAWTFWQYTSKGKMPGIAGDVDLDRFAGSCLF